MTTNFSVQAQSQHFVTPIILPTADIRNAIHCCTPRLRCKIMQLAMSKDIGFIDSFQNLTSHTVIIRLLQLLGEEESVEISWIFNADTLGMFMIMDDGVNPILGVPLLPLDGPNFTNSIASLLLSRGGGVSLFNKFEILANLSHPVLFHEDILKILEICFNDGLWRRLPGSNNNLYQLSRDESNEDALHPK